MFNLFLNENMKVYRRPRTWILIAAMSLLVVYINFVEWNSYGRNVINQGWENILTEENQNYESALRNGDDIGLNEEDIKEEIKVNQYHLENDISPVSGTMWSGMIDTSALMLLITVITIIVAGDSVAGEFSSGTIKLLLIRPFSRFKILVSKYITIIAFAFLLLLILFLLSFITNGILYGFKDMSLPSVVTDENGNIVEKNMYLTLLESYLSNGISTVMYVTMAFMISSAFRSSTMAITISIAALFAGNVILSVLSQYSWSKYLLFANTDLNQYLIGQPYQDGMTIQFSLSVLFFYYSLFIFISWLLFVKRDVVN